MQADVRSGLAEKMLGGLLSAVKMMTDLDPDEAKALALLESWDRKMTQDSAAAPLFEKLFGTLLKNLLQDELGDELSKEYIASLGFEFMANVLADNSAECVDDLRTTDLKETFVDIVRRSFRQAVAALEKELGRDTERWQWGRLHRLRLDHPMGTVRVLNRIFRLNRGPYPVPGSFCTVCPYGYPLGGRFDSSFGASHRHVFSLANWDDSLTVLPAGESGIPASPFYCDQTKLYVKNKYHSDYVSRDLVEKNARFHMKILPQP
jgi:penicillin amidase